MPAVLSDTALRWLEDIPPFWAGSKDVQATLDVLAREMDRLEASKNQLRANFFPQTADVYLNVWEKVLGLAVAPPDKTEAQRRASVVAFMQATRGTISGLSWQASLTKLIGTSWSYEEHDPADGTSPPANVLRITIPFTTALASPAAPTGVAAAGGALAAGTYHYTVSATNFYGETLVGPELAKVVTLNQKVTLDWADVAGATGYNVYRGLGSGAQERIASVTTSAYVDLGGQAPTGQFPPTRNSTASFQAGEAQQLARAITPAHLELNFVYGAGFLVGYSAMGDPL